MRRMMSEMLSKLEVEVLRLYVEGKSYQEIAEVLGRHVKSIDNALQRIKRKLDVHLRDRTDRRRARLTRKLGLTAGLAQSVEHFSCKEDVVGSIPTPGSVSCVHAALRDGCGACAMVGPPAPIARSSSVVTWPRRPSGRLCLLRPRSPSDGCGACAIGGTTMSDRPKLASGRLDVDVVTRHQCGDDVATHDPVRPSATARAPMRSHSRAIAAASVCPNAFDLTPFDSLDIGPPPRRCLISGVGVGRLPRMALSDHERAILDFEREWVLETGSKDAAIRERLAVSSGAYYKLRRSLIGSDEALAYEPLVVRRMRRDGESPAPGQVRGPPRQVTAATVMRRGRQAADDGSFARSVGVHTARGARAHRHRRRPRHRPAAKVDTANASARRSDAPPSPPTCRPLRRRPFTTTTRPANAGEGARRQRHDHQRCRRRRPRHASARPGYNALARWTRPPRPRQPGRNTIVYYAAGYDTTRGRSRTARPQPGPAHCRCQRPRCR